MMEAATPMKPKKGAEVGQSSEMVRSNTVESMTQISCGVQQRIVMNEFDSRERRMDSDVARFPFFKDLQNGFFSLQHGRIPVLFFLFSPTNDCVNDLK